MSSGSLDSMSSTSGKEDSQLISGTNGNGASPELGAAPSQSKYPKGVFFIVSNEFCERFSYYGMRAILVLYLIDWLDFDRDSATAIYHFFIVLCYFSPTLGAILADGFIGKYKTILYVSIMYAVGNVLMALTAFPPPFWLGPMISLVLIGLGTGGIKPCVAAFGGDQFSSDQGKQLEQFFSIFYFAINLGSLFSMILTPLIRSNVFCFNSSCFPLAFGLPAMLMIVALGLFAGGRQLYKMYPPTGNVIGQMCSAMSHAAVKKFKDKSDDKRDHWLDYADDKFETKFLDEVKSVMKVMVLFIPLPVFWALFDQQGSRWILQAREMDCNIFGWQMPPDLMQAFNPILIIGLIPFFEGVVYPLLDKCKIPNRPLQRMVFGMLLAAVSFYMAAALQVATDREFDTQPAFHHSDVRIINSSPCDVELSTPWVNGSLSYDDGTDKFRVDSGSHMIGIDASGTCSGMTFPSTPTEVTLRGSKSHIILLTESKGALDVMNAICLGFYTPIVILILRPPRYVLSLKYKGVVKTYEEQTIIAKNGGIFTMVLQPNPTKNDSLLFSMYVSIPSNQISILWQLPQYLVITCGEILFSISGLSFAYSQAPASMKSVLQASWLLTVAVGNVLDILIAGTHFIQNQATEFFVFATLMAVMTVIFGVMAYYYKYVTFEREYELAEGEDQADLVGNMEQHPEAPNKETPEA
ncbi:hypothetical protein CAPTEDRAFT_159070 [Capitella teleta]|uniref:Major facilitator superfamily (MFS) profile domain-containing protein n=1 Tax=Capitella teleta TaxID=283909 RepID=R7T5A1_CAPTE|nr:hypothetical protein CAPTEDRAFT_159070 [Capitella teleta]|eukprot:ELT88263.1 hypothetical protein CAPTEDRAFT_159070 [Capitella teleta]